MMVPYTIFGELQQPQKNVVLVDEKKKAPACLYQDTLFFETRRNINLFLLALFYVKEKR